MWVFVIVLFTDALLMLSVGNYPIVFAGLTGGACGLYMLTLGTRRAVRKSVARATGTTAVELTDEAVTIRRPGWHTEIAWEQYLKVVDTPEFLLLYISDFTFTAVLKRGLTASQAAELAAFVATLNGTTAPPQRTAPTRAVPVREYTQRR
ncbi:YcxB family protein [Kitasatospora sp. P5_F3]